MQLDLIDLDPSSGDSTLGILLKYQDDIERMRGSEAMNILNQVKAEIAAGAAA